MVVGSVVRLRTGILFLVCCSSLENNENLPGVVLDCPESLGDVREECFGLSTDILERFSLVVDSSASSLGERFVILVARSVTDALLKLTASTYLRLCHASPCATCVFEGANEIAGVEDIGLLRAFDTMLSEMLAFGELIASAYSHGQDTGTSSKGTLIGKLYNTYQKLREIERPRLQESVESRHTFEEALHSTHNLRRRILGPCHGAVLEILDALPFFINEGRMAGKSKSTSVFSNSAMQAYLKRSGSTSWPELVELARRNARPFKPFSRSSALCDFQGERLYESSPRPAFFANDLPFFESSGSRSWHGYSMQRLLQTLKSVGHPVSHNYVSIRPASTIGQEPPCTESLLWLYDPTRCLQEIAWGGQVFFLQHDVDSHVSEHDKRRHSNVQTTRALLNRRPRAWAGQKNEESHHGNFENAEWPTDLEEEPIDLLFLSVLAANCAILSDLLASHGSLIKFLMIPVNPVLPPPLLVAPDFSRQLKYMQLERKKLSEKDDRFLLHAMTLLYSAQCSLSQTAALLEPHGFHLLHLEHTYALFGQSSILAEIDLQGVNLKASSKHIDDMSVDLFEEWRVGWFCSPLAMYLHSLEEYAPFNLDWLGLAPRRPEDPVVKKMACEYMKLHSLSPDRRVIFDDCSESSFNQRSPFDTPSRSQDSLLKRPVALQQRLSFALDFGKPLPGIAYHLGDGEFSEKTSARATCRQSACECFAPFRGPRCDHEDVGAFASRPFSAAIHYIVNEDPVHIAELLFALRNLWDFFNEQFDYPVLIFHDDLSSLTRTRIALAAPNRIWFHRVAEDFELDLAKLPPDLIESDGSKVSHHSFSLGYRAQSRFRAGPVFAHPAVQRLDYLWSLDTDSMFPRRFSEDPFERMHANTSLVLGYQYITITSSASSKYLWEYTLTYLGYQDVDVVAAGKDDQRYFFGKLLAAPPGFDAAPTWNHKVVMTDCELMRVSFFRPGTAYFRYFEYLDTLGGFWLFRWGDHAVRALGTAIALHPHEHGQLEKLTAYKMKIPYAHQESCFCMDPRLKCVTLGKNASREPLWPDKKKLWECQVNASFGDDFAGDANPFRDGI